MNLRNDNNARQLWMMADPVYALRRNVLDWIDSVGLIDNVNSMSIGGNPCLVYTSPTQKCRVLFIIQTYLPPDRKIIVPTAWVRGQFTRIVYVLHDSVYCARNNALHCHARDVLRCVQSLAVDMERVATPNENDYDLTRSGSSCDDPWGIM